MSPQPTSDGLNIPGDVHLVLLVDSNLNYVYLGLQVGEGIKFRECVVIQLMR